MSQLAVDCLKIDTAGDAWFHDARLIDQQDFDPQKVTKLFLDASSEEFGGTQEDLEDIQQITKEHTYADAAGDDDRAIISYFLEKLTDIKSLHLRVLGSRKNYFDRLTYLGQLEAFTFDGPTHPYRMLSLNHLFPLFEAAPKLRDVVISNLKANSWRRDEVPSLTNVESLKFANSGLNKENVTSIVVRCHNLRAFEFWLLPGDGCATPLDVLESLQHRVKHLKSLSLLVSEGTPPSDLVTLDSLAKFSALEQVSVAADSVTNLSYFAGSLPHSVVSLTVVSGGTGVCEALKSLGSRRSIVIKHLDCNLGVCNGMGGTAKDLSALMLL